jgi:ectoine hydroxylase-related dioxygenase (phytanoyl-CoA dioxygenase family)
VDIREALDSQGYFELPPGRIPAEVIARARADVERRSFAAEAFLDDGMWDILDALLPVAREALGGEVAILPAFWAWKVNPTEQGWPKHRDNPNRALDDDGRLISVTLWVPLTDATTRNGCMHVVPAYWDWAYQNPKAAAVVSTEQAIRALPAAAGSVLGWSHALLHWGGMCAPGEQPRIATSYELIRTERASLVPRVYPAGWRPTAAERPAILAEMQTQYKHMLYQASVNTV